MPGPALTALSLSHFRSHKRLSMTLPSPAPVGLWGANGAGKTNVLEAISLLSPGRGLRRAASQDIARRPENVGWKIRAELEVDGTRHELETFAEPGAARQVRINGKAAAQVALGRIVPVVWLVPAMDRLWTEAAEGRRRFLDRLTLSFDPDHAERVLAYEKTMRERNRLLKDQVGDAHWYRALEGQMAEAGAAIHAARHATLARLATAQGEAATAFPTAELQLLRPDATEEDSNIAPDQLADDLAASRPRDLAAGRTLIGPHRSDLAATYGAKGLAARDCSTGEQKALLISLVLANARALLASTGAAPLLLLDEVAAHLDPDRRAALFDEICALGAQAWMTGTEAMLFDSLGPRGQMFHVEVGPEGSQITPDHP